MNAIDSRPLCLKIAGTVRREDFDRFDQIFSDADAAYWIKQASPVMGSLRQLLSRGTHTPEQVKAAALTAVSRPGFDVVQIRPEGFGYRVKVSAAPAGMNPTETTMSAPQAQQALPPEALQVADQQGVATLTGVEAEPDPLIETPAPITAIGLYKVYEAATGKQHVGYVIPGLFDPVAGGPTGPHLFVNGSAFSLQATPFEGTPVGASVNLPDSGVIRGFGVFFRANDKTALMTVPYEVLGEVTMEGRTNYAARDQNGMEVQIVFSPGLKRPVFSAPNTIALPEDCRFLALDNPIQLTEPGADPMLAAKAASADTRIRIEAWEDRCRLSGPAVEKVASGPMSWVDGLFYMAATGIPQEQSVRLLKLASESGKPIDLYCVQTLSPLADQVKEAESRAQAEVFVREELPPHCLLLEATEIARGFEHPDTATALQLNKEAAAAVGAQTVDAVLSLNFLNPENIDTFVENLPQLEDASSKLAQLSFATSLGLESVDSNAVNRAMDCLETVIEGLKTLRRFEV